jgi:hypothetical protein
MRIFFPMEKNILALPFFYFPYWEKNTPLRRASERGRESKLING